MDGTTWTHSSSHLPAPPVLRLSRLPGDTVATRSSHTILFGGVAEDTVIRLSIGRPSIGGPVLMNKWTLLDPPGLSTGSDDGLARLRAPLLAPLPASRVSLHDHSTQRSFSRLVSASLLLASAPHSSSSQTHLTRALEREGRFCPLTFFVNIVRRVRSIAVIFFRICL